MSHMQNLRHASNSDLNHQNSQYAIRNKVISTGYGDFCLKLILYCHLQIYRLEIFLYLIGYLNLLYIAERLLRSSHITSSTLLTPALTQQSRSLSKHFTTK